MNTPIPTSAYSKICRHCFSGQSIWWLPRPFRTHISAKQLNLPGCLIYAA